MKADYKTPVGLRNTRNFCYLHALLQYFNSIEPFRRTVLEYDDLRQEVTHESSSPALGKLAGSQVTNLQVEDGQHLVPYLRDLFRTLESAPGPHIMPSEDLAADALKNPPSGPSSKGSSGEEKLEDLSGTELSEKDGKTPGSESSDVTLIGSVLTPASDADDMEVVGSDDQDESNKDTKPSPPNHPPPPVPPRPSAPSSDDISELYKQQDAHEVSTKIIQRTAHAIKPESVDPNGDRHDQISDLFYCVKQYICTKDSKVKTTFIPDWASNLFLYMKSKPTTIQEGLDIEFGKAPMSEDDPSTTRYEILKRAPPILQLYIQHYDMVKEDPDANIRNLERVENTMQLDESIYLDRYMEQNQPKIFGVREKAWELRQQIADLQEQRDRLKVTGVKTQDANGVEKTEDIDVNDALSALIDVTGEGAKDLDERTELNKQLSELSSGEAKKIGEIDAKIPELQAKLSALAEPLTAVDSPELRYRLFAVFM